MRTYLPRYMDELGVGRSMKENVLMDEPVHAYLVLFFYVIRYVFSLSCYVTSMGASMHRMHMHVTYMCMLPAAGCGCLGDWLECPFSFSF